MKTINDLMEHLRSNNLPLIPQVVVNTYSYLSDYSRYYVELDNFFRKINSELLLSTNNLKDDNEIITYYYGLITSNFIVNNYKYEKLYNTMLVEYNPIENYDRKEINTTTHGTVSTTTQYGDRNNISTTDAKTDTTTEKISTFDSDTLKPNSENLVNYGINKVTSVDTSHSDTSTTDEYTDRIESSIHGNIGVTTTQQMITSERQIALFSFYAIIFNDITDLITLGVWDI